MIMHCINLLLTLTVEINDKTAVLALAVVCREITEKHHALLRRLDKESKTNKRLSMDREQLIWRLTTQELPPPSPDRLLRSASHPVPARSAPGTPSLIRRGVDVGTPGYRPLSQTDFLKFGPEHFIRDDSDDDC